MRPLVPLLTALMVLASAAAPAVPFPGAPEPDPAPGASAMDRGRAVLDGGDFLGRSPRGWMEWATDRLQPPLPGGDQGEAHRLADSVRALYAAVGVGASPGELQSLDQAAAALEPAMASAFAPLVAAVATGYAEQAALAREVDLAAIAREAPEERIVLPREAAMASVALAERLVAAAQAFRHAVEALPSEARGGGFSDPLGLVVLGTPGPDVFEPTGIMGDPVLLADPGGDDLDRTSAGGACPTLGLTLWADCNGLALSLRVDVAGSDTYHTTTEHGIAHGSGAFGGLGILVDGAGDDAYLVQEANRHGEAVVYYIANVVQGSGEGGVGLLLDLGGHDTYRFDATAARANLFVQGQGFAGLGGVGALLDADGDDTYAATGTCTGPRPQFCGMYVQGTGLYPGVAMIYDAAGNDAYSAVLVGPQEDYYSQAFAAFGALGMLDLLGDDTYLAYAESTDPHLAVSLNCAFGTAEYAGAVAVFLDAAGDDVYRTVTVSPNPPVTMSEGFGLAGVGLFWDVSGADEHRMESLGPHPVISGRGTGSNAVEEAVGIYLDTGGTDLYADVPAALTVGANDAVWAVVGVDQDLVPAL